MGEREQDWSASGEFGKSSAFGYTERSIIFPLSSSEVLFDPEVAHSDDRVAFKKMIVAHISALTGNDSKISIFEDEIDSSRTFLKIDLSRYSPRWWEKYKAALHACLESVQMHLDGENFVSVDQFSESPVGDYLRRAVASLAVYGDPYQGMFRVYDLPETEKDIFFMVEDHFVERSFVGEKYTRFELSLLEFDSPYSKLIACSNDPIETAVTHLGFMMSNALAYKSFMNRSFATNDLFGKCINSIYETIHWLGDDACKHVSDILQKRGVIGRSTSSASDEEGSSVLLTGSDVDVAGMLDNIFKKGPKQP